MKYTRRNFLHTLPSLVVLATTATDANSLLPVKTDNFQKIEGAKIKISLNAYSFNKPLREGQMTLDDLLEFCAELNFDALDLTAYYFPGYPDTPPDKYLYHIKKKAFNLGLEISGTGIKNDFIKTADQTLKILRMVDSEWFGLVLDIGSLRTSDPYEETTRLAHYAINWQIKEYVYRNGKQEKTDVKKIIEILRDIDYRGYIPIETLGPGDPREKVRIFFNEVKHSLD